MLNKSFPVQDYILLKKQLLIWSSHFSSCSFLDNHQYQSAWQVQECLVAAGCLYTWEPGAGDVPGSIDRFLDENRGRWIFGHLAYDLKDQLEEDSPIREHPLGFSLSKFFVPEVVVKLSPAAITIFSYANDPENIWEMINGINPPAEISGYDVQFESSVSASEYLDRIQQLKEHIHRGDCYEINYCQEFQAKNDDIDPVQVYGQLSRISPNPFSCYYRSGHSHLMCASPERFLMRRDNRLFSQPIKGTAARIAGNEEADLLVRSTLRNDPKELSENVMIVDLVRNDLSRICREGTVKVEELFGIYTYPNIHQMISTVSGEIEENTLFSDILKATFPMGSMTGAPKKRVMELIAEYEVGKRGLFSGAVGYFTPEGDFDFNVVIRSLQYNSASRLLSYWVGSGITWPSDPQKEYEECLLKAAAIKKVLQPATLSN